MIIDVKAKIVTLNVMYTNHNESRSAVASKQALEKWRQVLNKSKEVQARKALETNT